MPKPDVAIVGGGYAGLMAAGRLAIAGRSVVVVDPKPRFVDRLALHRRLAGRTSATRAWSQVMPRGADRLEGRATSWTDGTLVVQTASGTRALHPQRILIATGSRSVQPWSSPLVVDLENLGAAASLADRQRIVVVGGGATGIEVSTALAWAGRQVTLVADGLPGLSPEGASLLRGGLTRRGVTLVEDRVREVGSDAVLLESGPPVACDAVVPCLGFAPSPLAKAWGLPTDERGRVVASPTLQVAPGVYAAGDALTLPSMPWVTTGCLTAIPLGAHAAASIIADLRGDAAPLFRYAWTARTFDMSGRHAVLQRLEPDGTPTRATAGLAAAGRKAVLLGIAPRLAGWEAAVGRALYPRIPRTSPSHSADAIRLVHRAARNGSTQD